MIWGTWVDPNFKFWAHDADCQNYEAFCHAASEQELRVRLEAKNLTVDRIEIYDFQEWKDRAADATARAIQAYRDGKRPINFNQKIWKDLKWHLFDLFHDKCAYCESKPQNVSKGDVEHYRPKGKVKEDPYHPGYYWLAYDITNLLPSCPDCNQTLGKMNQFPVEGAHAHDPASLAAERPLLLNPYNRDIDPFEHIEFSEVGIAEAHGNSPYGRESARCYHLNRSGLGEARRIALASVEQDWNTRTIQLASFPNAYVKLKSELRLGDRQYSAAQLWQLDRVRQKFVDFLRSA
jgi:hypothetical protein